MALYKSFSIFQEFNTSFATECSEQDNDSENIIFNETTVEFIINKFSILLIGYPSDFFKVMPNLIEIISSNPNYCLQYITADHIQKLISFILTKEYCSNSIYFLDFILYKYPIISQSDDFFQLSEALFNNIASFFSNVEINDDINHLKNIIINSVNNVTVLNLFIESKCMKELANHIENYDEDNNDELLVVSLEIIKSITRIKPIPNYFEIFIYHLLLISNSSGEESILSLQILTQITKYSSIDVSKHIIEFGQLETSYIEDLVSFLNARSQNERKRIASIKFLSKLSNYGDPMFNCMINHHALFEVNEALSDKKDKIIVEALKLLINWLQNSQKYKTYLFHNICTFDFSNVCENSQYKVKFRFLKLLLYFSQNATPNDLTQLINYDTLIYIVDQIDDTDIDFSQKILDFLILVIRNCQAYPEFIQMIQNELIELEFNNPLLSEKLFTILELIKQSQSS